MHKWTKLHFFTIAMYNLQIILEKKIKRQKTKTQNTSYYKPNLPVIIARILLKDYWNIIGFQKRKCRYTDTPQCPLPPFYSRDEFLKNCILEGMTIFAVRGKATFWGNLLGWDQRFFLNISVFVILWSSVKEYLIMMKFP